MDWHVFEELVKKVQGSDAYPASAKFYPDGEGKCSWYLPPSLGSAILQKEPVIPAPYVEQIGSKELIWRFGKNLLEMVR